MEQSRAVKYITLFEGFKLGSLGVSGKPKATTSAPAQEKPKRDRREDIRIIHETTVSPSVPNPLILWEDFDKLLYMLEVTSDSNGLKVSPLSAVWYLRLSCAEPSSDSDTLGKHQWSVVSKLNTVRGLKKKIREVCLDY